MRDLASGKLNVRINFETNGGQQIDYLEVFKGELVNIENITTSKAHGVFAGWYYDSALHNHASNQFVATESLTLYARYDYEDTTVTFMNGNSVFTTVYCKYYDIIPEPALTPAPSLGYRFTGWKESGASEFFDFSAPIEKETILNACFVIDYLELPVMTINTTDNAPIVSKEEYLDCNASVSNAEEQYEFDSLGGKIKGRGNSTWSMPKKPYKLKFNQKIDLFGNGAAKTWTLIANYADPSMIRNYLAYSLGKAIGSDFVTETQFIDLFVNGEYMGVYLVCEQVEAGETRVNIDIDYDDVNTGYLLELDFYAPEEGVEDVDWFRVNYQPYGIKSPDVENANFTSAHIDYIKGYLSDAYDACSSMDIDQINNYIDVDSLFETYFIHELFNMYDVGNSSFYLYKDKDSKLKFGPLWDFDGTAGNYPVERGFYSGYDTLWAYNNDFMLNPWYYKLFSCQAIKDQFAVKLKEFYIIASEGINHYCELALEQQPQSVHRNYEKWQTLGHYVWPNPDELVAIDTWEGQVEYLRQWLLKSLDYMYNQYVDCSAEAYSITIGTGDHYSIDAFNTNNLNYPVTVLNNAWSRNGETGALLNDGNGQSIFRVNVEDGYRVRNITIDDENNYVSIETLNAAQNIYKISGISGNIVVTVEVEEIPLGYTVDFTINNGGSIMIYSGKDYSVDGDITNTTLVTDMSGDGQANFKVIIPDGYEIESIVVTGSYKNLKGPEDTGAPNIYRITKVAGNLTVNVTLRLI